MSGGSKISLPPFNGRGKLLIWPKKTYQSKTCKSLNCSENMRSSVKHFLYFKYFDKFCCSVTENTILSVSQICQSCLHNTWLIVTRTWAMRFCFPEFAVSNIAKLNMLSAFVSTFLKTFSLQSHSQNLFK